MSHKSDGKLSGWKAISEYLGGLSDDTLRRWAEEYAFPGGVALPRLLTAAGDVATVPRHKLGWRSLIPRHPGFVLLVSALFAGHAVASLHLETAYAPENIRQITALVSPPMLGATLVSALGIFAILNHVSHSSVGRYLLIGGVLFAAITTLLWVASFPVVPNRRLIDSVFPLGSARLGHLKNLVFALLIVLLFVLPEYCYVVLTRQRSREHRIEHPVRSADAVNPGHMDQRRMPMLMQRSWMFAVLLLIFVFSLIGGNILISIVGPNSGPEYDRFVSLLVLRYSLQFGLALTGWAWYEIFIRGAPGNADTV
jgi:hypothetical protein